MHSRSFHSSGVSGHLPIARPHDVVPDGVLSFSSRHRPFYIIANLLLGIHMSHGIYSMFQSLALWVRRASQIGIAPCSGLWIFRVCVHPRERLLGVVKLKRNARNPWGRSAEGVECPPANSVAGLRRRPPSGRSTANPHTGSQIELPISLPCSLNLEFCLADTPTPQRREPEEIFAGGREVGLERA